MDVLQRGLFFCISALAMGIGLASSTLAASIAIQPHRAIYRLELHALGQGNEVSNVSGRMEFEWAELCDAWTVSQKGRLLIDQNTGERIDYGWTHDSWESKDGLIYRFFIKHLYDGTVAEEVRGRATLEAAGKPGRAKFSLPEERELPLPAGTMFPTEHTRAILDAFRKDEPLLWKTVFDGSGENGHYGVSAARVATIAAGVETEDAPEAVTNQLSWRLHLAFYGLEDPAAAEPRQEQALRLFENGVADEMILDYEEFSVRSILEELELLPPPDC